MKSNVPHITEPNIPLPDGPGNHLRADTAGKSLVEQTDALTQHMLTVGDLEHQRNNLSAIENTHSVWSNKGKLGQLAGKAFAKTLSAEGQSELSEAKEKLTRKMIAHEIAIYELEETTGEATGLLRDRLASLSKSRKHKLDMYLLDTAPTFLREQYTESILYDDRNNKPEISWTNWLIERSTDDQLLNLFQWHIDTLGKQQQSEDVQEVIKIERDGYKDAVKRGVKENWLHRDAIRAVDKVDEVKVYVGDTFDTVLEDKGGYCFIGGNFVVIRPANGETEDEREANFVDNVAHAAKHEFNHVALGDLPDTWLREAATEHIALVMEYGMPDVLHPDSRPINRGTYSSERILLYRLLEYGKIRIPVELVMRAYSDPQGTEGNAYKEFVRQLDKSWGKKDVLGTTQGMIDQYIGELEGEDMSGLTKHHKAVARFSEDIYKISKKLKRSAA
jgi:hypothetical protein